MAQYAQLKDKAYAILKDKIITNELTPNEHLEEKDLCDLIGISRTPIREAINRLESEELVQKVPRKGIFVSDVTIQSAIELFQARRLFEPVVLKAAIDNLEKEKLLEFRDLSNKLLDERDYPALDQLDYQIHGYIASKCNNHYLAKSMNYISDHFHRVRTQQFYKAERTEAAALEHIKLMDYLLIGDTASALSYLEEHIANTAHFFFKSLTE